MLHKIYKLRELYPCFATKSIEKLTSERDELIKNCEWVSPKYWEPTLSAFCPDTSMEILEGKKRPTILVCPGGGYNFCSDREAEPIALKFVSMGYNVFVLRYECAPQRYPTQLLEAAASMAFIRENAGEFHVDEEKIAIMGFSAGAHLAASLSCFWQQKFIEDTLKVTCDQIKPNATVLCYPVITSGEFAHRGSFDALLGDNANKEMLDKMSLEKQVTETVPPTFIWQTFEDDCVPVENSMLYAKALKEKNIPFELHIFEKGPHGLSLCNEITASKKEEIVPNDEVWVNLCDNFLKANLIN